LVNIAKIAKEDFNNLKNENKKLKIYSSIKRWVRYE